MLALFQKLHLRTDNILYLTGMAFILSALVVYTTDWGAFSLSDEDQIGQIIEYKNDVRVKYPGQLFWQSGQEKIFENSLVFNGQDSYTIIDLGDIEIELVEPDTIISFKTTHDELNLSLKSGEVEIKRSRTGKKVKGKNRRNFKKLNLVTSTPSNKGQKAKTAQKKSIRVSELKDNSYRVKKSRSRSKKTKSSAIIQKTKVKRQANRRGVAKLGKTGVKKQFVPNFVKTGIQAPSTSTGSGASSAGKSEAVSKPLARPPSRSIQKTIYYVR